MIFPHALFVGTCIILKLLFPSFITYLARDTLLYFGLSVVYPWICTVALLHQYRHSSSSGDKKKKPAMDKEDAKNLKEKRRAINARYNPQSSKNTSYSSPTSSSSSIPKKHDYLRRRTGSRSSDARKEMNKSSGDSVPSKVEMYSKFGDKKKKQPKKKQSAVQLFLSAQLRAGDGNDDNIKAEARYWLRYWIIYGIVTGVGRMIYLLPIVGRIISKSTLLTALLVELKLLWIFWIYGLEWALANTSTNESDRKRSYKVRPLPFLTKKLIPPIVRCYQGISMQILTEETWNTTICTKAASFLELAVMIRLLSDSTTKQILHVIKYAHPFLIPGFTLLMPGFITEYGVIYVKSIVPSAKTFDYKLKKKAGGSSNSLAALPLSDTMHFLQYWVLQALLSAFLSWWSGILWWIPFSSHIIFCMWCRLQYSSDAWYRSLEMELSAFGLVPPLSSEDDDDDAKPLQIEDTMTLKILSRVIQALPSATSKATALLSSSNDEPDSAVTKTPPPAVAFEHAKTSPISFDLKKYETDEDDDTLDGDKGEKEEEAPKKNNTSSSPKEKRSRVDSKTSHEEYENGNSNNDDFDAPINDNQETNSDEDDADYKDDESEPSQSETTSSLRRSQRLRKNQQ